MPLGTFKSYTLTAPKKKVNYLRSEALAGVGLITVPVYQDMALRHPSDRRSSFKEETFPKSTYNFGPW
jgi:hypothetical protein